MPRPMRRKSSPSSLPRCGTSRCGLHFCSACLCIKRTKAREGKRNSMTRREKMTSEKLGARLLLEGYGVAIMGYHDQEVPLPECRLQSNVADPATAQLTPTQPSRAPKSILHVVSKGNLPADHAMDAIVDVFSDFTHTGRPLNGRDANMGFDTVSFVFPAGEMTNGGEEEFLADFDVEFREKAKSPGATAGPTMEIFRDTSMWPEDTNLHRTSIFDGWLVNGVDVLEKADMEEYRIRETEDMCI
eukprot:GEMP01008907.1.p2 GENE.GEMP01008907.1~~GEMP01008907.1.p2  ORF type:complete len:244 (+),score=69.57 GEMP01008907.1:2013-2744(+)